MSGYDISPKFCDNAPDEFLRKAHYMFSTKTPENLTTNSIYDKLSKDIWEMFLTDCQTDEVFNNKMLLWKRLTEIVKIHFPCHGLFIGGSTLNGFASKNGEVDITLIFKDSQNSNRLEAIANLTKFYNWLKTDKYITEIELIKSTVPLLKFRDTLHDLRVDLNYNNTINIRNTHLLYYYSQVDWRVRPLVLVVKLWAKCQNINDAWNQTINGYSLILMVIHFLQYGAKPAVLPCLQSIFVDKFRVYQDIQNLSFFENLQIPDEEVPNRNNQSLGELLIDFLKYYNSFEYNQCVISIRLGKTIPMAQFRNENAYTKEPYRWKCLCIEEPFTLTNTARAVYKPCVFSRVKEVIRRSYEKLSESRDLSSIFVKLI